MLKSARDRCCFLASEKLQIKKTALISTESRVQIWNLGLKLYAVYKSNVHLDGRITGLTNTPIRPNYENIYYAHV